ncbi:MAG TPA: vitamin K epoxide reductase family protein [Terriglobia bacterium]|jgi:uncharacterized membrane protein
MPAAGRPLTRTSPNWPLLALSVIGMLLTSYLTWTHWTGNSVKGCTVGSSCDIVLSSQWATLLGFPTSAWGFLAYASLAAIAFIKRADRHWWAAWGVAFFGLVYSAYLTTVSLTMLHAACPYCLSSLTLMIVTFALVTYQRPSSLPNFNWGGWLAKTAPVAAALIIILHLNYIGVLGDAPKAEDLQTRALAVHLAQSGAKMYGAYWCPHCQQQKSFFGASVGRLPYVECSPNGQNAPQASECQSMGIKSYPTWVINGKKIEEVMTLKQLADATGFQGPVTSAPN